MSKQFYLERFSLASEHSLVLSDLYVGPSQVPPHQDRVDLGAMAMKGYTALSKAPELLQPHHQIV